MACFFFRVILKYLQLMFQLPVSNSTLDILVSISNIIMPNYKHLMDVNPCFPTFKAFRIPTAYGPTSGFHFKRRHPGQDLIHYHAETVNVRCLRCLVSSETFWCNPQIFCKLIVGILQIICYFINKLHCVVFLFYFSSSCVPYVASFSSLSMFDCPFDIL